MPLFNCTGTYIWRENKERAEGETAKKKTNLLILTEILQTLNQQDYIQIKNQYECNKIMSHLERPLVRISHRSDENERFYS